MKTTIFFAAALLLSGAAMAQPTAVKSNTGTDVQTKAKPIESQVTASSTTAATVNTAPAANAVQKVNTTTTAVKQEAVTEVAVQKGAAISGVNQSVQVVKQAATAERQLAVNTNTVAGLNVQVSPDARPAMKPVAVQSQSQSLIGIQGATKPLKPAPRVQTRLHSGIGIGLH